MLDDRDPHWFNMHYEVANYLAWFAPGERVFLDQSLPYFRKAAEDYVDIRQALEHLVREQPGSDGVVMLANKDWQKYLHDRKVRYWIFDNKSAHKANLLARLILFTNPKEWVLCGLQGRFAIFAWRDPREPDAPDPARHLALDLKRTAFGPKAEPAPPVGVEPSPSGSWWETYWDEWWRPAPPLSLDREAVMLYDYRFQILEQPRRMQQVYLASRPGRARSRRVPSPPRCLMDLCPTACWR